MAEALGIKLPEVIIKISELADATNGVYDLYKTGGKLPKAGWVRKFFCQTLQNYPWLHVNFRQFPIWPQGFIPLGFIDFMKSYNVKKLKKQIVTKHRK